MPSQYQSPPGSFGAVSTAILVELLRETNARLVFADGPLAAREQCGVNAPTCYRRLVLFTAVGAIALDRNHRVMSVP